MLMISPAISVSAPKVEEDELAMCLSKMDVAKPDEEEASCGGGAMKTVEELAAISVPDLTRGMKAMSLLHNHKRKNHLATNRKIVKRRVRVRQEAIDMLLRDPPSPPISCKGYDNIDYESKIRLYRTIEFLNKMKMDEWDVILQYYTKGYYAEIDSYRYEDDE